MKKIVSMLLVITMIATVLFTGCSKETEAIPSTDAAETSSSDESTLEPLTISFSSTFQEGETGGVIIKHFIDRLAEQSEGAIDVKITWGGTLFTAPDELDAVIDGSVDMVALGHFPHLNIVNYLAFPPFAPGGSAGALEYFDTLVFQDPETSALIQGEAEALGIKYLNVVAGGANAFCSKFEFDSMSTLASGSSAFGNMDAGIFETLGFQVSMLFPPDIYDALNRGLIDSTQMALAPMAAMSWYEPAPYWALDGTYTAGNFFTVNLDWWNELSAEQQAIIEEAAKETQTFTATLYDEAIASDVALIEEKTGNAFVELSDEDVAKIWGAVFESWAKTGLDLSSKSDKSEGMTTILEKAAEITNYTWEH